MHHLRPWIAAALIAAVLTPSLPASAEPPAPPTPADHLKEAYRLAEAGQCPEARAALRPAEWYDPWIMPGKDAHMRSYHSLLHHLHTTCLALLTLTCPEGTAPTVAGAPVPCGVPTSFKPGAAVLTATRADGAPVRLRRVILQGAEHTTLRLDPPDDADAAYHWTPTSDQPIPEQNPAAARRSDDLLMTSIFGGISLLFLGLGTALLWQTYSGGDPADHPDTSRSQDDREQDKLDYIAGLSYGWMSVTLGAFMLGLTAVLFLDTEDPPPGTPPDADDSVLLLTPWFDGEAWGGGAVWRF